MSRVLSDNVDEFTCKICADFAESPVVTLCANKHVFCKACLEEWFLSSNKLSGAAAGIGSLSSAAVVSLSV